MNKANKETLRILANKFYFDDNLFDLVALMRIGADILEEEKFPMKEFAQYKYKFKRYEKKIQD